VVPVVVEVVVVARTNILRGMTLLELLLALALTVVVFAIISQAIGFHLKTFAERRDRVEQTQLARAILRHIANDLRTALVSQPVDNAGIESVASANPTVTSAVAAATGTAPNTTPPMNTSGEETAADPETEATAETVASGFYGDEFSLRFDISRLPRIDEFDPLYATTGTGEAVRLPADIYTIAYHLSGDMAAMATTTVDVSAMNAAQQSRNITSMTEPRSLLRSEQERSQAASTLMTTAVDSVLTEQTLADEVLWMSFLYFDGYEWWPTWDSDTRGGLPMAVEIQLAMADGTMKTASPTTDPTTPTTMSVPGNTIYRLVVSLPTAEPLPYEEPVEEDATMSETMPPTTTTNTTPSNNTGGGL
jgi:type II secretory pathway pseudopilin PulG